MLDHRLLPTEEDLPFTDGKPVDSELQTWVPALLATVLTWLWRDRTDWFFGVNLGLYYDPDLPAVVPDGFLSLGVPFLKNPNGRLSYLIWQENNIVPLLAIEHVSHKYNGEYDDKLAIYRQVGIPYYIIYNPTYWRRHKRQPLEMYRLIDGDYALQTDEPLWIPEINLGIGRAQGTFRGWQREWLFWFNADGDRILVPEEQARQIERQLAEERRRVTEALWQVQQERLRAEQAQQQVEQAQQLAYQEQMRAKRLADRLRALGIDPDSV
ncbi:MAG: Uma2 family endonuclease [Cyanobacteria bacterium]|nr:Uma2 family endonuclease [Cyanobacteriota bacterium]MDW8203116.1 Uma2 family endonuclease [Cyanobacteriota bacterium SKYGB_h_bin112]